MARGNWRNWEETLCSGCGSRMYVKDSKRLGGERYCTSCFKKADTKSTITSIDDLPDYVKTYARMWKNSPKDIIIVFPLPGQLTEADVKAIPISKKFIKINDGGYDDRGHWYLPLSEKKQGWHEPADHTGKAPEHVAASTRASTTDVLRSPMVVKDFDYFMHKFNLTPKTDKRVKAKGRVQREYSVEGNQKITLVINEDTEVTRWHEVGHLVAEDIAKQEFRKGGEMVFLTSLRTFQITDEEYKIISTMAGREEIDIKSQLEEDVKKIKNSIPPYDKIPESEKGRIIKQYKEQINMIEKKINYLKKSTEVFANFFAVYQINRDSSRSLLPRLYNQWGNIIDTYMRDA